MKKCIIALFFSLLLFTMTVNGETKKIDGYIFRTSDELLRFMQAYNPEETINWGEPKWSMKAKELELSGELTPDGKGFISLTAVFRSKKNSDIMPAEGLMDFFRNICEKTDIRFAEAEETIRQIEALDQKAEFTNDKFTVQLEAGNNPTMRIYSVNGKYEAIPYTREDAAAYMQSINAGAEQLSRSVSDEPAIMSGTKKPVYSWSGTLDEEERLYAVSAQYAGKEPNEGRDFLTAFATFFLTDDALDAGKRFIEAYYDVLETGKSEKVKVDDSYTFQLYHTKAYYRLSLSISRESIPSDALRFPNPEELAALRLDPIARLGIDKDRKIPKTILLEHNGMKLILSDEYYHSFPELRIVLRMEGAQEGARAEVKLAKINGRTVDFGGDIASSTEAYLDNENEESNMYLKLQNIKEYLPDFDGLSSLTFEGRYWENENSAPLSFYDITCDAASR
ncbi:MAG: hypothetical protein IJ157_03050 [Clostridia bacterium]|nr:hypothetical protein [Clostridia bacterium]